LINGSFAMNISGGSFVNNQGRSSLLFDLKSVEGSKEDNPFLSRGNSRVNTFTKFDFDQKSNSQFDPEEDDVEIIRIEDP
jgi:hypothetical protein